MFYEEFVTTAWSLIIPSLVMVGVLYAMGAEYVEKHMITFFPEVGSDALAQEEIGHLLEEATALRKAA